MMQPKILITPGEPAGIGPEIVLKALQHSFDAHIVVVAAHNIMEQTAKAMHLKFEFRSFQESNHAALPLHQPNQITLLDIPAQVKFEMGQLDTRHVSYVLATLDRAIDLCRNKSCDALVTGPVHKGIINQAGLAFTGHTEYLAQRCQITHSPVMMLANKIMKVALVTTHLPLANVASAITAERLQSTIVTVHTDLKKYFNLSNPRLLVCGLNPHAGEMGHLGREEIDIIIPTIKLLQTQGLNIAGPFPADTLFTPARLQAADVVIAMYHDQGLPVLKYAGFGQSVNITLGLPIIRTSVDHGTAIGIAKLFQADASSLVYAIRSAIEMAINKFRSVSL